MESSEGDEVPWIWPESEFEAGGLAEIYYQSHYWLDCVKLRSFLVRAPGLPELEKVSGPKAVDG